MRSVLDGLESRVRRKLSHHPVLYAIVDSLGIVLFWRGIWVSADYVFEVMLAARAVTPGSTITPNDIVWWDGPVNIVIGLFILLITGVFVSNFIGNEVIITGLRGDKLLSEETEKELRLEVGAIGDIRREVGHILERIDSFEKQRKSSGPKIAKKT